MHPMRLHQEDILELKGCLGSQKSNLTSCHGSLIHATPIQEASRIGTKNINTYFVSNGDEGSGVQVPWRPARREGIRKKHNLKTPFSSARFHVPPGAFGHCFLQCVVMGAHQPPPNTPKGFHRATTTHRASRSPGSSEVRMHQSYETVPMRGEEQLSCFDRQVL